MTPEHVALFVYCLPLVFAPILAAMLLSFAGPTRWFCRGFSALLLAPWVLLVIGAPQVFAQLA